MSDFICEVTEVTLNDTVTRLFNGIARLEIGME